MAGFQCAEMALLNIGTLTFIAILSLLTSLLSLYLPSFTSQPRHTFSSHANNHHRGSEAQSILPPQPNLLQHHLATSATRAILLHRIPLEKSHKTVSMELSLRLGKMLISLYLVTPIQNYLKASHGRRAMLEFASLADAIEAHQMLREGLIAGYEDSEPEYVMEGSGKQSTEKEYCGCLGCEERRAARAEEKERKDRRAETEVAEASLRASARGESESVSARGRRDMTEESESGSD